MDHLVHVLVGEFRSLAKIEWSEGFCWLRRPLKCLFELSRICFCPYRALDINGLYWGDGMSLRIISDLTAW